MKKISYSTNMYRDNYPPNPDAKNDVTKVMKSLESMGAPWEIAKLEKGEVPELRRDYNMVRLNRIAEKVAKEMVAEVVPGFDAALGEFMAYCQKMRDDFYDKNYPTNPRASLATMVGGRWIRIVTVEEGGGKSAWAFVDRTNGDVMKPAGWSAPAKHARANIFDKASWKNMTAYGPQYLTR